MLIWIHGGAQGLGAEHGILKADDVQTLLSAQGAQIELTRRAEDALSQAQQQIAQAQLRVEQILRRGRDQVQTMLEQARQSIEAERQRGYEEGMRQAVVDWHERQARSAMKTSRSLGSMHEKLAEVVTTAVERIVNTESRSALYQRALKNVQALTRGASTLLLRVSPADYEHARNTIASLGDTQGSGLHVDVSADPALKGGSCIFESDVGVLDASLETQLDGLRMAMARAVRAAVNRPEPEEPEEPDESEPESEHEHEHENEAEYEHEPEHEPEPEPEAGFESEPDSESSDAEEQAP